MNSNIIIICDICRRPCDRFQVCSVPGFPVSLNHCDYCLAIGAMPLFTAEATLCDDRLEVKVKKGEQHPHVTLTDTIREHGADTMKGMVSDWFLDSPFWIPPERGWGPGRYMSLRAYLDYLAERL